MTSVSGASDRFERALKRTGQLAVAMVLLSVIALFLLLLAIG
jgi:hypothetical protein